MPSMSLSNYFHITRASALYDIVATAPFATPWTFAMLHAQLSSTNVWLGGEPLAPFALVNILITCLMGSLVMLWSAMRLFQPSLALGRYDGAGRFMFAGWMIWSLAQGGLPLVWLFLIPEVLWGVAQCWPVERTQAVERRRPSRLRLVSLSSTP